MSSQTGYSSTCRANGDSRDVQSWLPLDVVQPPIRQSAMSTLFRCYRMFLFSERLRLELIGHKSAAYVGQVFHLAHNARYKGLPEVEVHRAVELFADSHRDQLLSWGEETGRIEEASAAVRQLERDTLVGLMLSQLHWEQFPLDTDVWEVVALEQDYEAKLDPSYNVRQPIAGRVDVVLRHLREPKGIFLLDHKTTSKRPSDWIAGKGFSSQARLYRLLVTAAVDEPVLGMVYNLVQKPPVRWKSWQTFHDYVAECRDWYLGRPDQNPQPKRHKNGLRSDGSPRAGCDSEGYILCQETGQRKLYPRWDYSELAALRASRPEERPMVQYLRVFHEPLMPEEFHSKLLIASRASRCRPKLSSFPTTGSDAGLCNNFYGRSCPFLPLCDADPADWEQLIGRLYRTRDADQLGDSTDDLL